VFDLPDFYQERNPGVKRELSVFALLSHENGGL
jgi:hypothetical protein